ncbi:Ureidoglycolate lyase [Pseudocercospora fuligena]|uniref:Ureidoglycolate lyase n=1 Tax=Pseudocercospora fuligena TaxID=685502 RepID=A0A8H6RRV3_9PEZI|nr:Ureidoglycolate lyase [Pseudocercospora fuligena]
MAGRAQKHSSNRTILASSSITPSNFSEFGTVIQNPSTHSETELDDDGQWRLEYAVANQGSATKWIDVTHLENYYDRAASGKAAKAVVNMFVCKPRTLKEGKYFDIKILERHPFTSQTFVPMGVGKNDADTRYLVVVAPTMPASKGKGGSREKPYPTQDVRRKKTLKERLLGARPNPFTNDYTSSTTPAVAVKGIDRRRRPKGAGEPDLNNLKAFIVRGDQAVTYGPGTWHAPMVALGEKEIEFVVMQYANGVCLEDCQEIDIVGGELSVDVSAPATAGSMGAEAPGYMRAKL